MIIDDKFGKEKINLSYDSKQYLYQVTEYESYNLFVDNVKKYMRNNDIKRRDFYPDNPGNNVASKIIIKDSDPYRGVLKKGLDKKMDDSNPFLFSQKIYELVKEKSDIDITGIKENALWLTSYAYEFFLITMVKQEQKDWGSWMSVEIDSSKDIRKSFTNLKKGFELLIYPIVPALIYEEFTTEYDRINDLLKKMGDETINYSLKDYRLTETVEGITKDIVKESVTELYKMRVSEGVNTFGIVDYSIIQPLKEENQSNLTIDARIERLNGIDQYPYFATFFIQMFINDAEILLKKSFESDNPRDRYDFSKNEFGKTESHGILKFYLNDFMPIVINKIQKLLEDTTSVGKNFIFYKEIKKAINEKKHTSIQYPDSKENWIEFRDDIIRNANLFNEWIDKKENPEFFNIFSDSKENSTEELFEVMDDSRTKKGRPQILANAMSYLYHLISLFEYNRTK